MMLRVAGLDVIPARAGRGVVRVGRWLPRRVVKYWYQVGDRYLCVVWQPRRGLFPLSLSRVIGGVMRAVSEFADLRDERMKRFAVAGGEGVAAAPLSSESKVLVKFPRLRDFLTATTYDDGTPRSPGRLWIENDGLSFVVTLFEPSAFLRVRLRAITFDDGMTLAETHLGMENAPWEVDTWARDRAQQKKKK